jgi:transposase-like protein
MGIKVLPTNLRDAIVYFSDQDVAIEFFRDIRWPDGVTCPHCGSKNVTYLATQRRWKCKSVHPKQQFSVKQGSIFEDSPLGLDKWLPAAWMVTNCKNGISSYELSRDLKVTQRTAWFMLHRVRHAMRLVSFEKFEGETEADETFVGGKIKNMHRKSSRRIKANTSGSWGKTIVLGLLNRQSGEVRAQVAPARSKKHIQPLIKENIAAGSPLYTDDFNAYMDLKPEFAHEIVNHLEQYVKGRVHTNGLENFWSLLKRTLGGTYISVDPFHLFRYRDEQCFRFNKRRLTDAERFVIVMAQTVGRRLTYKQLTDMPDTEAVQA